MLLSFTSYLIGISKTKNAEKKRNNNSPFKKRLRRPKFVQINPNKFFIKCMSYINTIDSDGKNAIKITEIRRIKKKGIVDEYTSIIDLSKR